MAPVANTPRMGARRTRRGAKPSTLAKAMQQQLSHATMGHTIASSPHMPNAISTPIGPVHNQDLESFESPDGEQRSYSKRRYEHDASTINVNDIEAFDPSHARIWFVKLKDHFTSRTSEAQKLRALRQLTPSDILSKIDEKVVADGPYETLKSQILGTIERSLPEKLEAFLNARLNNYNNLEDLAIDLGTMAREIGAPQELAKFSFLNKIPRSIAGYLFSIKDTADLRTLGKQAQNYKNFIFKKRPEFEDTPHEALFNIVDPAKKPLETHKAPEREMNPRKYDNKSPVNRRTHQTTDYDNIPYGLRPFSKGQRPLMCRFHIYFGDAARRCKRWCRYPNKKPNLYFDPDSRPSSAME